MNQKRKTPTYLFIIYIIPLITVLWILFIGKLDHPASLTRIDPEYVCLLNGLNVSILKFGNIGFTDSPGTPFLILTGALLRITHFVSGNDSIIDDVLSRPDYYIQFASYLFLALTMFLLIWGGKKVYKSTNSILALLMVQSTLMLSPICFYLQVRFNMDRLSTVLTFIFSVYIISYLYQTISHKKFAIISGIILGIGFITKFNFIVLTILPVLLLPSYKYWLRFGLTFFISALFSFLPILDKYRDVTKFIGRLFFSQGSYGKGEKGILNFDLLLEAFAKASSLNISFSLLIATSLIILVISAKYWKLKDEDLKKLKFLFGYILASIFVIVLASKNYKNYYLAPVLGLSGAVFFLCWEYFTHNRNINKQLKLSLGIGLIVVLAIPTILKMNVQSSLKRQKITSRESTLRFIDKSISSSDYLFLEPTWRTGALVEDALLYGISYVAGRNDFTFDYLKHYPNLLSYEGSNKPIKHCRTKDADISKIFTDTNTVYIFSGKGRNTNNLTNELRMQAKLVGMNTSFDTVFINKINNDKFIKANFIKNENFDYLKTNEISFFNNMEGQTKGWSLKELSPEKSFSGEFASKIKLGNKYSSTFQVNGDSTLKDQVLALTVSSQYFQQTNKRNNTRLIIEIENKEGNSLKHVIFCSDYFSEWNCWDTFNYKLLLAPSFQNLERIKIYFYNSAKGAVFIDDINIELSVKKTEQLAT